MRLSARNTDGTMVAYADVVAVTVHVDGTQVWPVPSPPPPPPVPADPPSRFKVGDQVEFGSSRGTCGTVRAVFLDTNGACRYTIEWGEPGYMKIATFKEHELKHPALAAPAPPKTLGELFRRAREAKGLSWEELANQYRAAYPSDFNANAQNIELWFGNAHMMGWTLKVVFCFTRALGIDPAEFHRVALAELEAGR